MYYVLCFFQTHDPIQKGGKSLGMEEDVMKEHRRRIPGNYKTIGPNFLKDYVKSQKTWTTASPKYMHWAMPFACEFCEYRTGTKAKLYQHAVKKHWHSQMASFLNTWGMPNSSTSGILLNSSKLVQILN